MVKEMTGEKESNPRLFELLVTFLTVLNDFPPREEYPRVFELRFLDLMGYRPRVTECALCNQALSLGRRGVVQLSSWRHGL